TQPSICCIVLKCVCVQACSLECGGALDAQILRSCGETLMENDSQLPLEDSPPEETSDPKEEEDMPEHLLAKKYGGFMKRYGGFMARRSPPHQKGAQRRPRALTASKTSSGAEAVKRYGGFMRRGGADTQGDALEALLGRGLEKRYGGFMRRVGRPEWLVDGGKTGVFKRKHYTHHVST
uniref:Synenkephalin n=1 Tax=Neogobius melanostomus TaxID=47308 RepID=A0A8C6UV14_9GOBI